MIEAETPVAAKQGGRALFERTRTAIFVAGLWIAAGYGFSELAVRVRDWFDSDEILYERLSITIARTHSLVPRIDGVDIHSFSQLYPLLLAPIFAHGLVPDDLRAALTLNAWVMTSACIPAFLLARRVTGKRSVAYAAAVLAVVMPWIFYSTMLMTEVVAYPVFLWAALALQRSIVNPSWRGDLGVALMLVLGYVARAELIALTVAAPLAIVAYELGRRPPGLRRALGSHRVLAGFYVVLGCAAVGLAIAGRLSDAFGVYGNYATHTSLLPSGLVGAFAEHVATLSLGFGVLPFVVGVAWLFAGLVRPSRNREMHAFACIGSIAVLLIVLQATHFDVNAVGYVYDRYMFYAAPIVVLAVFCAALERAALRVTLVGSAALVASGFAFGALHAATPGTVGTLLPDAPISGLFRPIVDALGGLTQARIVLALGTLAFAGLFILAGRRFGRVRLLTTVAAVLAVALPGTTAYVFVRYFAVNDWSERPLTNPGADQFTWVDQAVGSNATVAAVLYPVSSDWYVNQRIWRDFRISGNAIVNTNGVQLIDAGGRWRADWLSSGLYADGWTRPGATARIRVFAVPSQRGSVKRTVTFGLRLPSGVASRAFELSSSSGDVHGTVTGANTLFQSVSVCDVRLAVTGASSIPGDQASVSTIDTPRRGGLFVSQIALADELGGPC
jgi:hypothetical protein